MVKVIAITVGEIPLPPTFKISNTTVTDTGWISDANTNLIIEASTYIRYRVGEKNAATNTVVAPTVDSGNYYIDEGIDLFKNETGKYVVKAIATADGKSSAVATITITVGKIPVPPTFKIDGVSFTDTGWIGDATKNLS